MPYEHKIPANLNPTGDIIVPLCIPHDPQYTSLLLGVLKTLEEVDYYQRDPNFDDENAQIVAGNWRDRTITPLIEAIANGDTYMSQPVGTAVLFFGTVAPLGWLFCDGSAVSRAEYYQLFTEIGETYGAGDGFTTFNLPDMRGRVPVGAGAGTGLTNRVLGSNFGAETHQLTVSEMPAHNHNIQRSSALGTNVDRVAGGAGPATDIGASSAAIASKGGDGAHNNMQPSKAVNFIIRAV